MLNKKFAEKCRKAIPEGIVLLENDGSLPLSEGENIALFGRGQFEYLKSGSGSGGRVRCPYVTNIYQEIKNRVNLDTDVTDFYKSFISQNPYDEGDGWKPCFCQKEGVPSESLVMSSAQKNDKAVYIICRNIGESFDYEKIRGNWYLSNEEEKTISLLSKYFKNVTVLINSGNVMDLTWIKKYSVGTVAYIWQGGQEGGAGTVDAIMGDTAPSGRLTSTIIASPDDYPCDDCFGDEIKNIHKEDIFVGYRYFETFAKDKVLYPFGYGLNYTTFKQTVLNAERVGDTINLTVNVENTGNYSGKDVVQVYYSAPQGMLGKPSRQLIAFKKTELLQKNQSQTINLSVDVNNMSSYDDSGKTGNPFAWVLEEGTYGIFVGQNVRDAVNVLEFSQPETRVVKQCVQALPPVEEFERIINTQNNVLSTEKVTTAQYDVAERIKNNIPPQLEITGDKGISFSDVSSGKSSVEQFIAQFDVKALAQIVRSEGMSSPKATYPGTASCFAGTTKVWNEKGVPVVTTCDGPSGIRMESGAEATCIPVGALLAAAWAPELFEDLFKYLTEEMKSYDVDVLLAPGMNIHRSGLCGRNFEYFSEDPYLTGIYASKITEYFTKNGFYCTLKHFAVNSQETNRYAENEVLSERALREVYLKPFEIAVKHGFVRIIMTSYNKINGVRAAGNYDLTTTILRDDWGYDGLVISDWGTEIDDARKEKSSNRNLASMVKSQNDVYSIVGDAVLYDDDIEESVASGYLTVGELQRCAKNILNFALNTYAFKSGRTQTVDDLSSANELIFTASITEIPLEIRTELDTRYQDVEKRMVELNLPDNALYCVEILYNLSGTDLEQKNIWVYIDNNEPVRMVGVVTGKSEKQRFKAYINKNSKIYFEEGIEQFNIYKI